MAEETMSRRRPQKLSPKPCSGAQAPRNPTSVPTKGWRGYGGEDPRHLALVLLHSEHGIGMTKQRWLVENEGMELYIGPYDTSGSPFRSTKQQGYEASARSYESNRSGALPKYLRSRPLECGVCVCVYYICIYTHIHSYIYTYIHMYIYTHI